MVFERGGFEVEDSFQTQMFAQQGGRIQARRVTAGGQND
jgi:hypothetical protein